MNKKLLVIVNGHPVDMELDGHERATIFETANRAIKQSGYKQIPSEQWEYRDVNGSLMPGGNLVTDTVFINDRMFVSLKAGVAA